MPRSTLASDPRKGMAHERRTTTNLKRLTPGDTLMLRLCSPLAKHFESRGETLVLGLALNKSIQVGGCRDPFLVWKGQNITLDAHPRRELCIQHKKQVKVREVELPDEKAAIVYILQI